MTYHRLLAGFIILFIATACHSNNSLMQRIMPSSKTEPQPLTAPPPPPTPKAAQDQVSLPPKVRSLKDTIFPVHDNTVTIALLLPLTGPSAALGKDLQDAAQLALFDVKNADLKMLPLDTRGTPEGAVAAMDKAVAAHASIVLGPLFSQEAFAIAPTARAHDIPVVSFSNNTELATKASAIITSSPPMTPSAKPPSKPWNY